MNAWESYISYLHRGDSLNPEQTVFWQNFTLKEFVVINVTFFSFFSVIHLSITPILKYLNKKWYDSLDDSKKFEMGSYFCGFFHHPIVVSLSVWLIYVDVNTPYEIYSMKNYSLDTHLALSAIWSLNYLLADTVWFAIPDFMQRGNPDYSLHHLVSFVLIYGMFVAKGAIVRFLPLFSLCESTALCFNIAFILRLAGLRDTIYVTFFEHLFAVLFFITRVFNLTFCTHAMLLLESVNTKDNYPIMAFMLISIAVLQYFWFYKIMVRVIYGPKKKDNQDEKTKKL